MIHKSPFGPAYLAVFLFKNLKLLLQEFLVNKIMLMGVEA